MFFGTEEIRKNVHGTFQKFFYKQTVFKTEKTEKLFNFSGDRSISVNVCFVRDLKDMQRIIEIWNNAHPDGIYKYELLYHNAIKNTFMDINEVIDEYNRIHKFESIISHTLQNNVELLQ